MSESPKKPDWDRIEADYRAGVLSVREIAASQGISHTAINKRAKAEGWERDLSAKIQQKADALVSKQVVSSQVSMETAISDRTIIESNAALVANVHISQRKDISRARSLAMALLAELEGETGGIEHLQELGDLMFSPDERGRDRLNEIYQKVISSAGRIDSMKKLAETLRHLVSLEREAYGIKEAEKPDSGVKMVPVTDADRRL